MAADVAVREAGPVRIGACVVAHGRPATAELVGALRAGLDEVVVVATSPGAAPGADLVLANVGYGTAANAAFLAARGPLDWWLVSNDDLLLDEGGAARLRERLAGLDDDVALWSFTGTSEGTTPRRRGTDDGRRAPHGALLAVRADVFAAIGGFDPRYFLYSEEVDIWLRLPNGARSGSEQAPYVRHAGGGSTVGRPAAQFELGRSLAVLLRRHRHVVRGSALAAASTASLTLRRRRPVAAAAFAAGYVTGMVAPRCEAVAARRFGAAPLARRREVGWIGPGFERHGGRTDTAVSVVMCTYNGAAFVGEQLASIARQTFAPVELIVGDDGSTDATLALVEAFAATVPFPVRVERWAERAGPARNFERTMQLATGDLVAFTDQDDVWHPDRLARQVALLDAHPQAPLCFGDASLVDGHGATLPGTLWDRFGFRPATGLLVADDLLTRVLRSDVVTGATMVVRRRFLDRVTPIGDGWMHDAWIAALVGAAGGAAALAGEPVIAYRLHASQQVGAPGDGDDPGPSLASASDVDRAVAAFAALVEHTRGWDGPVGRIADKHAHLQRRRRADGGGMVARAWIVSTELARRRYARYSNGWRSAVSDLIGR